MVRSEKRLPSGAPSRASIRTCARHAFDQHAKAQHLSNMVLILLSVIFAALAVAISMLHTSFGILAGSRIAEEDIAIGEERSEQRTITQ
jgi:hypothetical protein